MPPPQVAPPPGGFRTTQPATKEQSRAVTSLILSIAGFAFCGPFTAIPGMILGKMELNAIRDGRSPQSNENLAKAGFYIGMAVTILWIVMIIVMLGFGIVPAILSILHNR